MGLVATSTLSRPKYGLLFYVPWRHGPRGIAVTMAALFFWGDRARWRGGAEAVFARLCVPSYMVFVPLATGTLVGGACHDVVGLERPKECCVLPLMQSPLGDTKSRQPFN